MPKIKNPPVAVTPIAQAVTAAVDAPAAVATRATKKPKAVPEPAMAAAKATPPAAATPARRKAVPAAEKSSKPKLVRDSFTIPKDEYQVLDALKARALGLGQHVKKSELLRAGIRALSGMPDKAFLKAVQAVPTLKTGRPKSAD